MRKLTKRLAFGVTFVVLFLLFAQAVAAVTIGSVVGIWTGAVGGGGTVTGLGTNEVRWGTPVPGGQKSGYRFVGVGPITFVPGEEITLGTFTHFNFPIYAGTAVTSADLQITLGFIDPPISPVVFNYTFDHEETPNISGSCPTWQQSSTPCDDRVTFPTAYGDTSFQVGDILYTLEITGFEDSSGNTVSAFITEEYRQNHAYLKGRLSSVLVPEPDITIRKEVSVDGGTTWHDANSVPGPNVGVGSPVQWRYVVQNTGNVDLENISVTDSDPGVVVDCSGQTTLASGTVMYCYASGTAVLGQYENTGYVTATVVGDTTTVDDDDLCHYRGVDYCEETETTVSGPSGDCLQTFDYTVYQTGHYGLSHWVLGLPTCFTEDDIVEVRVNGALIPQCGSGVCWSLGWDPTCGFYGLKFDNLPGQLGMIQFSVMLDQEYHTQSVPWRSKFDGCDCASGTTRGPSCNPCCEPPTVTDPTSLSCVCVGDSATFSVTATGTPPLHYQWKKDGGNISGANSATLVINPVSAADEGSYTCYVWNDCGNDESAAATLDVDDEPPTFTCPTGSDLGCNLASLPDCVSVKALVTGLDDNCDESPTLNCVAGDVQGTCDKSQTFTLTATDDCGNTSDPCYVTYTWTDDSAPPTFTCPTGSDLGCNPASLPDCVSVKALVTGLDDNCDESPTLNCVAGDVQGTCDKSQTFTLTATDDCGNTSDPCYVTYTWTDDSAPPTFTCPTGSDLGCNPASLPDCVSVKALVTGLDDNCDESPTLNCVAGDVQGTCDKSQTFTLTATDDCGNTSDPCYVTYTWTDDSAPPTFTCPTGSDLGCNPASLPDCVSVKALVTGLDDNCDESPTLNCVASDVQGTCDKSQTFTLTATDDCGNTSDPCYVTYTWDMTH